MKTVLITFLLWTLTTPCTAQWVELDPGIDVPYFSDVYAITPDIVVVVGANGTILKTTDGGDTWVQKPSGTTENLRKVQFPAPNIGYTVSAGDAFLKTTNGGETWNPVDTGNDCYFYNFSCVDENQIFITCSGNLMNSEDGGDTWDTIAPLTGGGEIIFLSESIGFSWEELFGDGLHKTVNGGETWENLGVGYPAYFLNENTGFFYDSGLYKTTDGGNNFDLVCGGDWWGFTDIFAPDENNVWGILVGLLDGDGSTRGIAKISSQDGENFTEVLALENDVQLFMNSIHFADENIGYIVGSKISGGAIWKNVAGINTMATSEYQLNDDIKVYPNPASNELNIVFNKPLKATITLTDITGKQLYSKSFTDGSIKINTSMFPKGFYILKVNNYSQKIIIN